MRGGPEPVRECWVEACEMTAQQLEHTRDGGEHGDTVSTDELNEARCVEAGLEVDLGGEQWRHPKSHELAKDVRERKGVEKAKGMKWALVAPVSGNLALDGIERSEHIAVGVNNAFGFGGGTGGKDDLEGRAPVQAWIRYVIGRRQAGCIQSEGWDIRRLQLF